MRHERSRIFNTVTVNTGFHLTHYERMLIDIVALAFQLENVLVYSDIIERALS